VDWEELPTHASFAPAEEPPLGADKYAALRSLGARLLQSAVGLKLLGANEFEVVCLLLKVLGPHSFSTAESLEKPLALTSLAVSTAGPLFWLCCFIGCPTNPSTAPKDLLLLLMLSPPVIVLKNNDEDGAVLILLLVSFKPLCTKLVPLSVVAVEAMLTVKELVSCCCFIK